MYFELSNLKSENNFSIRVLYHIRGRGITFLFKKNTCFYLRTHNTQHTTHTHFSQDLPESVSNFS